MIGSLNVPPDVYFSEDTKVTLRANIDYLKSLATTEYIISPSYVQAYRYDFARILRSQGVPIYMQWVHFLINEIDNPNQDMSGLKSYLTINPAVIDSIISRVNTQRG